MVFVGEAGEVPIVGTARVNGRDVPHERLLRPLPVALHWRHLSGPGVVGPSPRMSGVRWCSPEGCKGLVQLPKRSIHAET